MSGRAKYRNNRNRNPHMNAQAGEHGSLSADSPILAMFLDVSRQLTDRQDRHERLVKLSRDITIESKRIIFLLHSPITQEKSQEEIIAEAKERLDELMSGPIKAIAIELEHVPAYLHARAITPGLQEFVEARTLCSVMENKNIITYPEVQNELALAVRADENINRNVSTLLPHVDYMLGLSDLTGEMMRRAINSISGGDQNECAFASKMLRQLYSGFLGLFGAGPAVHAKLSTTRMNVHKVEQVMYALRVRGSEAPPRLLLPIYPAWEPSDCDMDEGYYYEH